MSGKVCADRNFLTDGILNLTMPRQVQDLLGHKNPQTTAIYVHINDRWKANPGLGIDDKESRLSNGQPLRI
jgi:integrase